MKSTVENLGPTRVKITVEVPFDELKADFDRAYKALAQQVNIPGFRRGKAPARVLEARIGRGPVLEQVVNDMLPARLSAAVEEHDVKLLGRPDVDVTRIEDGELVEFVAEADVRPEIALPDFTDIAVEVDALTVSEEDVDSSLDALRGRFGTLEDAGRAAEEGDLLTIDLAATVDGVEIEDLATSGMSYEVGSDDLVDGLDEAVRGLSAGESAGFSSAIAAGDHAGEDGEFTVSVSAVKTRTLPEADDAFAEMASEFDTIDELRDDLRTKALEDKKGAQSRQISDKVLAAVFAAVEIPVPEGAVTEEAEMQIRQIVSQFGGDTSILDIALQAQGQSREEFDAQNRQGAEESVRTRLFLDTVAEELDVEVSQDELSRQIMVQAAQYGMDPNQFVQQLQRAGQIGALYADVRRGKALGAVVRQVTVTDSEGAAVDVTAYFPEPETPTGEAAADATTATE